MGRLGKMVLQLEDGTEINLGNILKEGVGNKIKDSDVMVPVDVQSRYQKTVPMISSILVPNNNGASVSPNWIETTGYDHIAWHQKSNVSLNGRVQFIWSNDGVSNDNYDLYPGSTVVAMYRSGEIPVKAKWFKMQFDNLDATTAQTVSVTAMLKV